MDRYIELVVEPRNTYWAEVEYLSTTGEWRVIGSLTGEAIDGAIRWPISVTDFNPDSTYRWRIFRPGSLDVLARSALFSLPKQPGETVCRAIRLVARCR